MNPQDIPTEITDLADTCPYYLKPTIVPTILAHFWPAIEAHLREQIATEIEQDTTPSPWSLPQKPRIGTGDQWIDSRDCTKAAAIARGTHTT